jgi:hypothetical protein
MQYALNHGAITPKTNYIKAWLPFARNTGIELFFTTQNEDARDAGR